MLLLLFADGDLCNRIMIMMMMMIHRIVSYR